MATFETVGGELGALSRVKLSAFHLSPEAWPFPLTVFAATSKVTKEPEAGDVQSICHEREFELTCVAFPPWTFEEPDTPARDPALASKENPPLLPATLEVALRKRRYVVEGDHICEGSPSRVMVTELSAEP
tara:strand:- start:589 stop:981 length:393 start_codon:yes stop_codon:yes gene_type:complete